MIIERATIVPTELPEIKHFHKMPEQVRISNLPEADPEVANYDMIKTILKSPLKALKLIYELVRLIMEFRMSQNKLDTVKGIIRAIFIILGILGLNFSQANVDMILTATGAVWAVVEMILGYISNNPKKIK